MARINCLYEEFRICILKEVRRIIADSYRNVQEHSAISTHATARLRARNMKSEGEIKQMQDPYRTVPRFNTVPDAKYRSEFGIEKRDVSRARRTHKSKKSLQRFRYGTVQKVRIDAIMCTATRPVSTGTEILRA